MQLTQCPDASQLQRWRDASIRSVLVCLVLFIALIGGVSGVLDAHTALAQRQSDVHGPVRLTPIEGLQRVGSWTTDGATEVHNTLSTRPDSTNNGIPIEALRRIGSWTSVPVP